MVTKMNVRMLQQTSLFFLSHRCVLHTLSATGTIHAQTVAFSMLVKQLSTSALAKVSCLWNKNNYDKASEIIHEV